MQWLRWGVVVAIVLMVSYETGRIRFDRMTPEPAPCGQDLALFGMACRQP